MRIMTTPSVAQEEFARTIPAGVMEEARSAGRQWGDKHVSIWDSWEAIGVPLREYGLIVAEALRPEAKWRHTRWFWVSMAGLLLLVVCAAAGGENSVARGFGNLFAAVFLIALFVTWARTNTRNRIRPAERAVLAAEVVNAGYAAIESRRQQARAYDPSTKTEGFSPGGPAPAPQPYGVSHEGAERLVAEWMRYLGAADAERTRFTGDGGIDVASQHYIAQVKNYAGSVDIESIRALGGVAYADGRKPLFFTSGGYTASSVAFATQVRMGLFRYDAVEGRIEPRNDVAARYMTTGL